MNALRAPEAKRQLIVFEGYLTFGKGQHGRLEGEQKASGTTRASTKKGAELAPLWLWLAILGGECCYGPAGPIRYPSLVMRYRMVSTFRSTCGLVAVKNSMASTITMTSSPRHQTPIGLQALATRAMMEGGEALIRLRYRAQVQQVAAGGPAGPQPIDIGEELASPDGLAQTICDDRLGEWAKSGRLFMDCLSTWEKGE
ncbi:hypothetical protein CCP4SC76_7220006 [Gammaproteobacteria bacterium]